MKFALNTVMFIPNIEESLTYAKELGVPLELLPAWHEASFVQFINKNKAALGGLVSSFHEPFYLAGSYPDGLVSEHAAPRGSEDHIRTLAACRKTLEIAAELGAKEMVFHHNNHPFAPNEQPTRTEYAAESLAELNNLAKTYGISILVENAGTIGQNNMLFDETAFIALFANIENDCILDIGHAHANGWNVPRVMSALGDRIKAYHIHDNDGTRDAHLRIGQGTFDWATFQQQYHALTPNARLIFEYSPACNVNIADIRADMASFQ
ncbi:MAG: sugar phosphate isomerase/epimerase [Oscillospiraceae bacterium]|nr:sugar phosphate isomerase/epimerase [Oscillospiraceae bacterium]